VRYDGLPSFEHVTVIPKGSLPAKCSDEVPLVFVTRTRGFVCAVWPVALRPNLPIKQPTKPHIILVSSMERIAEEYSDAELLN